MQVINLTAVWKKKWVNVSIRGRAIFSSRLANLKDLRVMVQNSNAHCNPIGSRPGQAEDRQMFLISLPWQGPACQPLQEYSYGEIILHPSRDVYTHFSWKRLYTNICSIGNNQKETKICVQLQDHDLMTGMILWLCTFYLLLMWENKWNTSNSI